MAEGGDLIHFGYVDPDLDHNIDHDDNDDEQEVNRTQQEVNRTQHFTPQQSSTPYHGGEQITMQTMQHEQSGMPSYYERTSLLSAQQKAEQSWDALTANFPEASASSLETTYSFTNRLQVKMAGIGKKAYNLFTIDKDTKQRKLNQKLPKEILKAPGPSAEQIIVEDRDTIQEQRQRLAEAQNEEREAEKIAAAREEELQEMENLKQQTERTQARIDALQEEHGSNIESEAELRRLKQFNKNYKTEYENKKKEVAALEKQAKNKQKVQEKVKEKVQKERAKLDKMVKKRNLIEERLNSTKPLDDLNGQEAELRQQNSEDQAIIDATDTSSSERQAAEARVEERNEVLERLQAQIAEREEAMPLRERVKEIFKKNGVTVTAILIAAGVVIGAVMRTLTKGLKATGKAMANGLKEIAAKLASMLPGLIGQIASFLFKTAANAVGFLAEHTWLIILAVVAFLFEKYIKKRR